MDLRGWDVRVVAVGVVAVLVLAGCNGGAEVEVTPAPTPVETVVESASPSPSPSPTALTDEEVLAAIPEAARAEGFWGAQEFARFFLIESQEMVRRQDGRLFEALSDPECTFCLNSMENLETHKNQQLQLIGGELTVLDQLAQGSCSDEWVCHVEFDVDIAQGVIEGPDGEEVSRLEGEKLRAAVEVKYGDGVWSTTGVGAELREVP